MTDDRWSLGLRDRLERAINETYDDAGAAVEDLPVARRETHVSRTECPQCGKFHFDLPEGTALWCDNCDYREDRT